MKEFSYIISLFEKKFILVTNKRNKLIFEKTLLEDNYYMQIRIYKFYDVIFFNIYIVRVYEEYIVSKFCFSTPGSHRGDRSIVIDRIENIFNIVSNLFDNLQTFLLQYGIKDKPLTTRDELEALERKEVSKNERKTNQDFNEENEKQN